MLDKMRLFGQKNVGFIRRLVQSGVGIVGRRGKIIKINSMNKLIRHFLYCLATAASFSLLVSNAGAQGTAFIYQGQLLATNGLVNGSYDLTFTLFATDTGGFPVAGTVTNLATVVDLSLIHISEPTRLGMISYAVFCLKKKKKQ